MRKFTLSCFVMVLSAVVLMSTVLAGSSSCGNHVCEPDRGERWDTCSFDCCKTDDCDKEHNVVDHPAPPQTPGHGGTIDKNKAYRYKHKGL
jgi:hypothetical protein